MAAGCYHAGPLKEESVISSEEKSRPDFIEVAYRVGMEATGQWPKTEPPEQAPDEDESPEAVCRGCDQNVLVPQYMGEEPSWTCPKCGRTWME